MFEIFIDVSTNLDPDVCRRFLNLTEIEKTQLFVDDMKKLLQSPPHIQEYIVKMQGYLYICEMMAKIKPI